ncbi:MAG: hypothetical protein WCT77_12420 [Bacteroidota bacterium]
MNRLLLLLGPSGVGKSTIINELCNLDNRFIYISPYITRKLRDGENNKISIGDKEMEEMSKRGEFLCVNEIYNTRYGTPKFPIIKSFEEGNFPVLDWPAEKIGIMEKVFSGRLYVVYMIPPSIDELKKRLSKDSRDPDGVRLKSAIKELIEFESGRLDNVYDLKIISRTNCVAETAQMIYKNYIGNK